MICMQKWCQNCQVGLIWHTFFTKNFDFWLFFIKKWCQNSLSTEGPSEFKADPLNLRSDPLNLRSDPLNLRSDPLNLRSDPLNLRSDPLNLRSDPLNLRSDPLNLRSGPLNLRSDPLNLRSGPLNLRSDPLNLRSGPLNLRIDPVSLRFCSRTCNKVLVTFEAQTNDLTATLHNRFGCSHQQKAVTQSRQHIDRIWPLFLVGSHVCACRFTRRPI